MSSGTTDIHRPESAAQASRTLPGRRGVERMAATGEAAQNITQIGSSHTLANRSCRCLTGWRCRLGNMGDHTILPANKRLAEDARSSHGKNRSSLKVAKGTQGCTLLKSTCPL